MRAVVRSVTTFLSILEISEVETLFRNDSIQRPTSEMKTIQSGYSSQEKLNYNVFNA